MPSIRVRKPFAAAFALLLVAAAYLGLSTQKIPQYGQSDKGLHLVTFFLLTVTFYWVLETSRRRMIHLSLLVCTAGLAIGSEVLQALLPNGRNFDPFDILANVVGSALALSICSWYHKRMLERKRKNKHYDLAPGEELGEDEEDELGRSERDVELGTGVGVAAEEPAIAPSKVAQQADAGAPTDVTEELDNWDENAEDWDEEPSGSLADGQKTAASNTEGGADTKKRIE